MKKAKIALISLLSLFLIFLGACGSDSTSGGKSKTSKGGKSPIKIGLVASLSGALEAYGKQTEQGLKLGIEYATNGTNKIDGHPIQIISKDGEAKPEVGVKMATELLTQDKVDFIVGASSSAVALAMEPLAQQYQKIMIVEPAAADSITGENFNKYVFRTARNSSQDAAAGAAAIAKDGVKIATLAPDYAFGHDGVDAFKKEAVKRGAKIVAEEYPAPDATDFTANIQKIIDAKPDYLFVVWAGANTPWKQLQDMKIQDHGIKLSTGAPDIAALKTMKDAVGMEGFTVYYYKLPKNDVNDWLVKKMKEEYNSVPDLFTPGGMSAGIAIVDALKKAGVDASSDDLIKTMEGMSFDSPKGKMTFRKQDHQALQALYKIKLEDTGLDYPEPTLIQELSPKDTEPPVLNKK
ncbi:MAG: substrate-binding domain-containing protein [Tuberibacillus sp.]